MGYYTRFTLEWSATSTWVKRGQCAHTSPEGAKFCMVCGVAIEGQPPDAVVAAYIDENTESVGGAIDKSGRSRDACKWYEWKEDLTKMSRAIPGVVFHLSGEGEDNADIWDAFALDGKLQVHKAKIVRTTEPEAWGAVRRV